MGNLSATPDIWQEIAIAICLVFILEGLAPFLLPAQWRNWLLTVCQAPDGTLRLTGLVSMLLGLTLLYLVN
jgi:uncharacterized protein